MLEEAVMTHMQISHKPPVTDLWLLVDEEQTMHYGLRHAWRWLETEQCAPRHSPSHTAVVHADNSRTQVCCQYRQMACIA
jgi:hypothetical protein